MPDTTGTVRLATFDQHRSLLFSVAYRMLGTVADAEDMLQETFIRWQQAGEEEIQSPRAFLVTIVSRLCINHLQSARVRREEYVGQWLPEPIVTDLCHFVDQIYLEFDREAGAEGEPRAHPGRIGVHRHVEVAGIMALGDALGKGDNAPWLSQ